MNYTVYGKGYEGPVWRLTEPGQSYETAVAAVKVLGRWANRHDKKRMCDVMFVESEVQVDSIPLPVLYPQQRWATLAAFGVDIAYTLGLKENRGFYVTSQGNWFTPAALGRHYRDIGKVKKVRDGWAVTEVIVGVP